MHIKDIIIWHIKESIHEKNGAYSLLNAAGFQFMAALSKQPSVQQTFRRCHTKLFSSWYSHSTKMTTWLHRNSPSWFESRTAHMGPWWRKCNLVEEIRFRRLDPTARLSSRHSTFVWTLIGSSGWWIVFGIEYNWRKTQNNNSARVVFS